MNKKLEAASLFIIACALLGNASQVLGQSFGVELHNTTMPVSGAMGGASIASPKDPISAINGNPAGLSQYDGINFTFSGAWIEPTFNMEHTGNDVLPDVEPFAGKSDAQGSLLGNIGYTYDMRPLGIPMVTGTSLVSASGAAGDFSHINESNGTSTSLMVLQIITGSSFEVTEQLSFGGTLQIGNSFINAPFIGIRSNAQDYALRGKLGMNFEVTPGNRIGCFWETEQSFTFDHAVRLQTPGGIFDPALDLSMDLPENFGIGIATDNLMCGRLHVAMDVLYKRWDNAALYRAIFEDQWVLQTGMQYTFTDRIKLRAGYAFAEDIVIANPGINIGGISPPGATDALQYVQALIPAYNQHRISCGIGIKDALPGMDLDLFAGGMLRREKSFGNLSSGSLQTYWVGFGMTYHFGSIASANDTCETCKY